ncbi:hypothetical protein GCM10011348_23310 [Marinobacterium nitratireducens]|uniref:DUF2333 domain-containing protein n=1 Tax=Marinobacterium nitratireducens TaxID=518897 RepID=A0A917ZHT7_9GAMM|nr:DUF2333 family protein [Marinobacterium nitratireducens]GGO82284.1 hypothetical protein GCM10011348_23310 [Marinobacterium nitratireducens]
MEKLQRWWLSRWDRLSARFGSSGWFKWVLALVGLYLLVCVILGMFWSWEPGRFDVRETVQDKASAPVGAHTTGALIQIVETLLDKPGGYLRNDRMPPGVWLDNVPRWEYGALVQARDASRAMRKAFSRSQSQSTEDPDLIEAEPLLHFNNNSWLLPPTEREYRKALTHLRAYQSRMLKGSGDAEFHARADNLREWLADVSTRLGSLSQRLSASVGRQALGAVEASSGQASNQIDFQTPWMEIDNVFYEARGTAWALLHLLEGVELDFAATLEKKEALVSLQQIIRELEATQNTIWSPFILNGTGFGLVANHSLVMASYISRANAGIIDLRDLLSEG